MDEFRDLRHVSAIGGLVKDDIDVIERGRYCAAIAQVTFNEFHLLVNPPRLSATVGLRFKVVEAVSNRRKCRSALGLSGYSFFRAVSVRKNSRVCGAISADTVSVSSSLHNRHKLAPSSTSYPSGNSLISSPISRARCLVWSSTRPVLQSIRSKSSRCSFLSPIR